MTWEELEKAAYQLLDDTGQEFTGQPWVRTLLESAELFATIHRGFPEITNPLLLDPQRVFYRMHNPALNTGYPYTSFIDIIAPLRVTIAKTVLERTTLSSVCIANREWAQTYGTPESWFFIGGTILVVYPLPFQAMVADVTYIRVPPWEQLATSEPYLARPLHSVLPRYVAALEFGVQGDMAKAQAEFDAFVNGLGIRDPKFLPGGKQRGVTPVEQQVKSSPVD